MSSPNFSVQASDEPMRAAPSVKPSEWCAETPLDAIIDGDAIAKSKRIMALIDSYMDAVQRPQRPLHARDARTAIRCALMAEFEVTTPRATADMERVWISVDERLPEREKGYQSSGNVLVVNMESSWPTVQTSELVFFDTESVWRGISPTHWMPLPPKPGTTP